MTVAVTVRDTKEDAKTVRASGRIPAIIYGRAQTPLMVAIDGKAFEKLRKEAGESTVLSLTGLTGPVEVLIKDVDFNPVMQRVMHVDFYAVEKGKEITTNVTLHFIGIAPVEESRAGSVTKVIHEVEVTSTPVNLPSHINVDMSVLKSVEDKIHISDLVIPAGVKIHAEPEDPVAVVSPAKQTPAGEGEVASEVTATEEKK